MRINTRCRHAILLTILLTRANKKLVTTKEMNGQLGISISYLEQMLATLRDKKIVQAIRGPGGGYQLTRDPNDITVAEIFQAFQGERYVPSTDVIDELGGVWQNFCQETWKFMGSKTIGKIAGSIPVSVAD